MDYLDSAEAYLNLGDTFFNLEIHREAVESYKFFIKTHYVVNYFVCKITAAISEGTITRSSG
jgi:hypothetical protein